MSTSVSGAMGAEGRAGAQEPQAGTQRTDQSKTALPVTMMVRPFTPVQSLAARAEYMRRGFLGFLAGLGVSEICASCAGTARASAAAAYLLFNSPRLQRIGLDFLSCVRVE